LKLINVLPPEITQVHTYARKILFKGAAKNPASVSIGSHDIKFRAILDAFIFSKQYDPRGCTAIVYFNTVQCSPKFMAIIVASTNIAVPYRYLDTGAASHSHGHA